MSDPVKEQIAQDKYGKGFEELDSKLLLQNHHRVMFTSQPKRMSDSMVISLQPAMGQIYLVPCAVHHKQFDMISACK